MLIIKSLFSKILKHNFEIINFSESYQVKDSFINNKFLRNEGCRINLDEEYFDFLYKKVKQL